MITLKTIRAELAPTLRLALPLVLAELGWMSMAIVDTMMVGRLPNSAAAIGAISLGGILVNVLAFFGEDCLLAWTRSFRKPSARDSARIAIVLFCTAFTSAWYSHLC